MNSEVIYRPNAIGGRIELTPGVVSRTLALLHIIAVASPAFLKGRTRPTDREGLAAFDGLVTRSSHTADPRSDVACHIIHYALVETPIMDCR